MRNDFIKEQWCVAGISFILKIARSLSSLFVQDVTNNSKDVDYAPLYSLFALAFPFGVVNCPEIVFILFFLSEFSWTVMNFAMLNHPKDANIWFRIQYTSHSLD